MKHYDGMAAHYDSFYADDAHRAEDEAVTGALMPYLTRSVLDVGCGTGLLLDYAADAMTDYLGIDPSIGMLTEMLHKHPDARVTQARFEDFVVPPQVDLVVSLFGTASYISPERYEDLRDCGKDYFVMFYKPGYAPAYDPPEVLKTDYGLVSSVFRVTGDWHDFRIATSLTLDLT